MSSPPLRPTYTGLVSTTYDALVLFEACLDGRLAHVPRRPHDRERADLIRSGHVFIYEEHSSGIKRWTDGVSWSPSRILGNFLVYRELNQTFGHGEKKRALKRPMTKRPSTSGPTGAITKGTPGSSQTSILPSPQGSQFSHQRLSISAASSMEEPISPSTGINDVNGEADEDRELVGSLTDSYDFKAGGLVKKTISIRYQGISHHLVSYYSIDDAKSGGLRTPSQDVNFTGMSVRNDLLFSQAFRAAISEYDSGSTNAGGAFFTNGYMAIPHAVEGPPLMAQHPPPPHTHMQGFYSGHAFPHPPTLHHGFHHGQDFYQHQELPAEADFQPNPGLALGVEEPFQATGNTIWQ